MFPTDVVCAFSCGGCSGDEGTSSPLPPLPAAVSGFPALPAAARVADSFLTTLVRLCRLEELPLLVLARQGYRATGAAAEVDGTDEVRDARFKEAVEGGGKGGKYWRRKPVGIERDPSQGSRTSFESFGVVRTSSLGRGFKGWLLLLNMFWDRRHVPYFISTWPRSLNASILRSRSVYRPPSPPTLGLMPLCMQAIIDLGQCLARVVGLGFNSERACGARRSKSWQGVPAAQVVPGYI